MVIYLSNALTICEGSETETMMQAPDRSAACINIMFYWQETDGPRYITKPSLIPSDFNLFLFLQTGARFQPKLPLYNQPPSAPAPLRVFPSHDTSQLHYPFAPGGVSSEGGDEGAMYKEAILSQSVAPAPAALSSLPPMGERQSSSDLFFEFFAEDSARQTPPPPTTTHKLY